MKYDKPPLTIEQQVDLLLRRGMLADRDSLRRRLAAVNYYRLSGYWYPFRTTDDSFKPGTTLDQVWERYVFDRHLRLLVMDALGRVEIAVRTQLAYNHGHHHGAFGYATQPDALPKLDAALAIWHSTTTGQTGCEVCSDSSRQSPSGTWDFPRIGRAAPSGRSRPMACRLEPARSWPAGAQGGHQPGTERSGAAIAANLREVGYGR